MNISIHPAIDNGIKLNLPKKGIWSYINNKPKPGGTLSCKCEKNPIVVKINSQIVHNHLCGCTQCWKPEGALFSQVALVPRDKLTITKNENKLEIIDKDAPIQRHACSECGAHMFGRVENKNHHFYGLDFIHIELSKNDAWPPVQFVAFVPSIIESGFDPENMHAVKEKIHSLDLESYDEFSPEINEFIASRSSKMTYKNKVF